jgi:hypothetical protein
MDFRQQRAGRARSLALAPADQAAPGRALAALALAALLLAACGAGGAGPQATPSPQASPTAEAAGPVLRITNNSEIDIERLVVIFPEDRVDFGAIAGGATTEYLPVPNGVYHYAAYELEVGGERYELPVIDWMGEEPVPGEAFTWRVDVNPDRGQWEIIQLVQATVDR